MKLRLTSLALLVALMGAFVMVPRSAAAETAVSTNGQFTGIPVTGTVTGATLTITKFIVDQNGALAAQGVVKSPGGGVLGNFTAPVAVAQGTAATCNILNLTLGPLDLNLLGLRIQLNQVVLTITAQSGAGNLLGNLLCAIANLLNPPGPLALVANLLNAVLGVLKYSPANPLANAPATGTVSGATASITKFVNQNGTLAATGVMRGSTGSTVGTFTAPVSAQSGQTCTILDLTIGPINLNLLGLVIQTNTIHLTITAESGPGNLLGNLLCAIANLLNPPGPLDQLVNLLNLVLLLVR